VGGLVMYAINAVALLNASRMPEHLALWLVLREMVTEQTVQPVKNVPGHDAVLVRDDVDADRWQAIVQIVRRRFKKNEFLLYAKENGRWKKV